jgi:hypothetical protein
VFQLADVAVPWALFTDILRRIDACGYDRGRFRHEDRGR